MIVLFCTTGPGTFVSLVWDVTFTPSREDLSTVLPEITVVDVAPLAGSPYCLTAMPVPRRAWFPVVGSARQSSSAGQQNRLSKGLWTIAAQIWGNVAPAAPARRTVACQIEI